MITTKTVFVLGAGASKPYGFPLGGELRDWLRDPCTDPAMELDNGDIEFVQRRYDDFGKQLRESRTLSVDAFLEFNKNQLIVETGKELIARYLIPREDSLQTLSVDNWFDLVWDAMRCPPEEFHGNRASFIVYNYDRCLEHLLYSAIVNSFHASEADAWTLFQTIEIVHPHGLLGDYAPMSREGKRLLFNESSRTYNPSIRQEELQSASECISLYWESTDEQRARRKKMATLFREAERIIFLGFGFLNSNMSHLWPMLHDSKAVEWHATGRGLPALHRNSLCETCKHDLVIAPQENDNQWLLREQVNLITAAQHRVGISVL